jgi:GDP/UDP-N,N'-diacetylbacillosamine 2-epimerase (hydrolysing)
MKKICFVTGSRAEYGLLYPLIKAVHEHPGMQLQLAVSGTHLSQEHGNTQDFIIKDGFHIDERVDMLEIGDSESAIIKSMGNGLIGFADAFERLNPDIVVILGDRFEAVSFALAAYMHKIPIAHLHGGELTEGANDDALRHTITKLSWLHFTSTDEYRKRVIQLGESPDRVFNTGAIGLDNIRKLPLLDKKTLAKELGFDLRERYAVITYHPVTLDDTPSETYFTELLHALDEVKELQVIFTMPNADADSRIIAELIQKFVKDHPDRVHFFTTMGQLRYLSALKNCFMVIGNSSSGIIEAPSFGIPTINIGDRQKGRVMPATVIQTGPDKKSILAAIAKASDNDFRNECRHAINPYGSGHATEKIMTVLEKTGKIRSIKKQFFDLS